MSKKEQTPIAETELVVDNLGELSVNSGVSANVFMMSKAQYAAMQQAAKEINPDDAVVVTAIYKEFAQGETVTGVFVGLDGITPKETDLATGEVVGKKFCRSIKWMGSDGRLYQNAGAALVNQFWNEEEEAFLIPIGTRFTITHTGKSNRTKLYEVGIIV